MPEFQFQEMFPHGPDTTPYRKLSSDYVSVTKSIREAQMPASLAAPFHNFAETLFRKPEQEKKRFIERFAVVPMRYGFRTHAS